MSITRSGTHVVKQEGHGQMLSHQRNAFAIDDDRGGAFALRTWLQQSKQRRGRGTRFGPEDNSESAVATLSSGVRGQVGSKSQSRSDHLCGGGGGGVVDAGVWR